MENRIYNFSPGPSVLADEVLVEVRNNLANFHGSGLGVMELSHRGPLFENVLAECEQALRELLCIPQDYSVLFTTGGATLQFSMVPMNFIRPITEGNYILTGVWAEAAYQEAKKFGETYIAGSTKAQGYRSLPREHTLSANPAYLHFTSNNTVYGSQWRTEPDCPAGVPLICDASSDILSRPVDLTKYKLIYAGAQKNIGIAGVTLVILHNSLLEEIPAGLPMLLDYRTYAKSRSMHNTPPTFPIYVMNEVLKWLKRQGGLSEIARRNQEKAELLYSAIDQSSLYRGMIEKGDRSLMNVTFELTQPELEPEFLKQAEAAGLHGLKGHRLLGGLRASIYNAFPREGVEALVGFMKGFEGRGE